MAATINASTSAGLVQSADTTGNLNIQSNGSTVVAVTSAGWKCRQYSMPFQRIDK